MSKASKKITACPCGSGQAYSACCEPLHQGMPAADARALMRSRYAAYVLGLADYLRATWHATTLPEDLEKDLNEPPLPQWIGLDIKAFRADGDAAQVEFVARFKVNGRAHRLHEISDFVHEDGRWLYVSGTFPDDA
ncbi:MAG TPA: YchJ family metal-binding protein [Rhodocyclaceae bacterium]|nr:YchJ family metal-binding protein [Rhodocyclaceae bacterium]